MMQYILYYKAYYGSIISKDVWAVDLMKSENKKKDSEGRSCKKIAKDNKAVWNLELIQ